MMNKKMGAEAWGAAELGSAAPMGAAAMGSGGGVEPPTFDYILIDNAEFMYEGEGPLYSYEFQEPKLAERISDPYLAIFYDGIPRLLVLREDGRGYVDVDAAGIIISFPKSGETAYVVGVYSARGHDQRHTITIMTMTEPKYVEG